jgi:DNA-directed RNA polymerase subunit B
LTSSTELFPADLWSVLEVFFREVGLSRQHLDSYNEFVEQGLQKIVDEVREIPITLPEAQYSIRLGKVAVGAPRIIESSGAPHEIYPLEARLRNLSYSAPMYLEMSEIREGRAHPPEKVHIGDLPVMLKSRLCNLSQLDPHELPSKGEDQLDPGGYFIINGSERVIVGLEDLAPNRIITDEKDVGSYKLYTSKVFSSTVGYRTRVEVRLRGRNEALRVYLPGVATEIPFVVILKALGMESDKDIAETVSPYPEIQELLQASFDESEGIYNQNDALLYIGNRAAHGQAEPVRRRKAESLLDRVLLPHLDRSATVRMGKAIFLCEMTNRVLSLKLGWRGADDKDHYGNKRVRLAGPLLAELFRTAFRKMVSDIRYQLERTTFRRGYVKSLAGIVTTSIVTDRLSHAISTGNWGRNIVGITQLLDRTNYLSMLSHLRRIQSPLSRSQPNFEARDLHSTHWGRIDPNETPEGSNCGLVKNLSLSAVLSVTVDAEEIKKILYTLGVVPFEQASPEMRREASKVFVDGTLLGFSPVDEALVSEVRRLRRRAKIPPDVNIARYAYSHGTYTIKEVHVNCDAGRVRRPLIRVEEGNPILGIEEVRKLGSGEISWGDLINNGIIELLDAEEEENTLVANEFPDIGSETTHMEISPHAILSVTTSLIPFSEHNHSPRNSYEAAMAKQALGYPMSNIKMCANSRSHLLHTPQKPLVKTDVLKVIGLDSRPLGQNFVLALLSHPYNMEDALVLNKASVERGLARSTTYRIYEAESRLYAVGEWDKIEIPDSSSKGYRSEEFYRYLEGDGLVTPETAVNSGDVLVGRTSPPRFLEEYKEIGVKGPTRRDTSVAVMGSEDGVVDSVLITETRDMNKLVKVKVRDTRVPEVGDKFASRHGQKGVVGMLVPQEDMPFTETGLVPDAILNPHAIPSRMTAGHILETLAGKAASIGGKPLSGTPFTHTSIEDIKRILLGYGFMPSGNEVMYSGITGQPLEAAIYVGIVYYQRLHHMVKDKIHARARGQVQLLTRQPTEGRARGGGLRFGEMERDCLVGHGAARLLQDRLLEESDKAIIYVCENCGYIAYYDSKQRRYVCRLCEKSATVSPVQMSYAFKLLLQEMMSLSFSPRLVLKERV